jgi:hypothetical protein
VCEKTIEKKNKIFYYCQDLEDIILQFKSFSTFDFVYESFVIYPDLTNSQWKHATSEKTID